uniref:Secreted protein n=1 Tax=Leptocylindrus danicus TaxID=163516 RepID=A0A7S2NV23_9STRA|mmetsp:Transcript_14801/g.21864  ORF Transcript_14801/g.21864 Transcript_14801/m.21864 type:complete len:115 (+) Transcript_14801:190-534(+)
MCRSRGKIAILVIFGPLEAVSYTMGGGSAAFITICHCGSGTEVTFMVWYQFLSKGGGLVRCGSRVMAESVFWSRWDGWFRTIDVSFRAVPMVPIHHDTVIQYFASRTILLEGGF